MSDILARIDEAIEEAEGYVEWHGSVDAATWSADGSHEVDTSGRYYGDDIAAQWYQGSWYEILRDSLTRPLDREVFDPSWVRYVVPTPLVDWSLRWRETWREIQYDATVTADGSILWHRDLPPDPAETLRDVVVDWQTGPVEVRPIEAVLREIREAADA